MTDLQVDETVNPQGPETQPDAELGSPEIPSPATEGRTRLAGVRRPVSAVMKPVSGVMTIARTSVTAARSAGGSVAARLPGTIRATRVGAHEATSALQVVPDPTLRSLAATSVGLGVGLYLAGAPRLVVAAGVVPALIMGTAIVVRPVEPLAPAEAGR